MRTTMHLIALFFITLLCSCTKPIERYEPLADYKVATPLYRRAKKNQPSDKSFEFVLVDEIIYADGGHPVAMGYIRTQGIPTGTHLLLVNYSTGLNEHFAIPVVTDTSGYLVKVPVDPLLPLGRSTIGIDATEGATTYLHLIHEHLVHGYVLAQSVTPHPTILQLDDGAEIELVRLEKYGNIYVASLRGFKPSEKFIMTSTSGRESIRSIVGVSKTGLAQLTFAPGVIGVSSGTATLSFIRDHKTYSFNCPWSVKNWSPQDHKNYQLYLIENQREID